MNRKFLVIVFVGLSGIFFQCSPLFGYGKALFPVKNDLTVVFNVVVEKSQGKFNYLYTLRNSIGSKQVVEMISVQNRGDVGEILTPSSWDNGLYNRGRNANSQANWFPGRVLEGEDDLDQPPLNDLGPGEVSDPFGILKVHGLPGIVEWKVTGWIPDPELEEGSGNVTYNGVEYTQAQLADTDFVNGLILKKIFTADTENFVRGFTLGPAVSPLDQAVICDTFILDLIAQVHEAAALGWIKHDLRKDDGNRGKGANVEKICHRPGTPAEMTLVVSADAVPGHLGHGDRKGSCETQQGELPEVAQTVIEDLARIRELCMTGRFSDARRLIREILALCHRERGRKTLTEESYALIKFNAEFLLEKL